MVDVRFSSSLQIMLSLAAQARQGEELMTSQTLSEGLGTNPALVRKLLIPLSQAGLIETFKGKTGGVRIAKSPKQITLRDIYEAAVDKDIACTRETTKATCPVGACMQSVFKNVASGMESAVLGHLQSKTLQQILTQAKI